MSKKILSNEELAGLSRQLALVVDSDLSMQEGLDLILEQTESKILFSMISKIKEKIQKGSTVGQAIKDEERLPGYYINMILVGEESGNLHVVLLNMAESYEKEIKTAKKVRSAITYPIVLSLLMLGVIILLITTIMPMFKDILDSLGGQIPSFTNAIIDISTFLGNNIIPILGLLIVLLLSWDIYRNTPSGRKIVDKLKLKIPVQKDIVTSLAALRFSRNMAMLIRSGIPTVRSLKMIKPLLGNLSISDKIEKTIAMAKEGTTIKNVILKIDIFPSTLVKLLSVAESTGHLEEMFNKSADIMSEELDNRLERLTSVLEPFLIIILSLILGAILLSVILPVIGIMNSIG